MKRRQLWFRLFRRLAVAHLVLLLLLLAVSFPRIVEGQRQAEVVSAVASIGGRVRYDFEVSPEGAARPVLARWLGSDYVGKIVEVDFNHAHVSDAQLAVILRRLPALRRLHLWGTPITDEGLRQVGKLSKLEMLWLDGTAVTDRGVEHLRSLDMLEELLLQHTCVTDRSMPLIAELPSLWKLALTETAVTDKGLAELAPLRLTHLTLSGTAITDGAEPALSRFRQLENLDLRDTAVGDSVVSGVARSRALWQLRLDRTEVTDAAIDDLTGLRSLRVLSVAETRISPPGALRLRKLMPGCLIVHNAAKKEGSR